MDKISHAASELREMDELATQTSPIHDLHPLSKLLVTIAYILIVVSFHKYDLTGMAAMVLFPVFLFQASGIHVSTCFYKLRIVLPLVCAVGLANPFFDRVPMLTLGNVVITGGVISMFSLMLKGTYCLMASFLLVATTPMDAICAALRKLHIPGMLVTLLLLTYRYISVMVDEVAVMTESYHLRAPGQKGIHISAWGSFLGQLLLRSMDRAEELYSSMELRGFKGEFYYVDRKKMTSGDWLYVAACVTIFFLFRSFNVAAILGSLFV